VGQRDTVRAGIIISSIEKGMKINWEQDFCTPQKSTSS